MQWKKSSLDHDLIRSYSQKFGISKLLLAILYRRGLLDNPQELLYYSNLPLSAQHSPFLLPNIETALRRLNAAIENREIISVYGDRDVDGVTSTTLLVSAIREAQAAAAQSRREAESSGTLQTDSSDAEPELCFWHVPCDDDPYGLTDISIDRCKKQNASLLITVDCGISNKHEIDRAAKMGIETIIIDHHNCPAELPNAVAIVNPKLPDSLYPFPALSACALAYKFATAWSYYNSSLYDVSHVYINYSTYSPPESKDAAGNRGCLECIRVKQLCVHSSVCLPLPDEHAGTPAADAANAPEGKKHVSHPASVIRSQLQVICDDAKIIAANTQTAGLLRQLLGSPEIILAKENTDSPDTTSFSHQLAADTQLPQVAAALRTIALSNDHVRKAFARDCQLVTLSTIADMMPLANENRILVRNGLAVFQAAKRCGLRCLNSHFQLSPQRLSTHDLSFSIIPLLNSAGRMGRADIAVELLLTEDQYHAQQLTEQLLGLHNNKRRLMNKAWMDIKSKVAQSFDELKGRGVLVASSKFPKSITGQLANKLLREHRVTSIVIATETSAISGNDTSVHAANPAHGAGENISSLPQPLSPVVLGSMRTDPRLSATEFLLTHADLLTEWGGHDRAAGFRLDPANLEKFCSAARTQLKSIGQQPEKPAYAIDAFIPKEYLRLDLFEIVNQLEPYGMEFPKILFHTPGLVIESVFPLGKLGDHFKIQFNTGHVNLSAVYWNPGKTIARMLTVGNSLNVLYNLEINYFRNQEQPRMSIVDVAPGPCQTSMTLTG